MTSSSTSYTVPIVCRGYTESRKPARQSKALILQLKLFAWIPPLWLTVLDCTFFECVSVLTSSRNGILVEDIRSIMCCNLSTFTKARDGFWEDFGCRGYQWEETVSSLLIWLFYPYFHQYEVWWINFSLISLAYRGKLLFFLGGKKALVIRKSTAFFNYLEHVTCFVKMST